MTALTCACVAHSGSKTCCKRCSCERSAISHMAAGACGCGSSMVVWLLVLLVYGAYNGLESMWPETYSEHSVDGVPWKLWDDAELAKNNFCRRSSFRTIAGLQHGTQTEDEPNRDDREALLVPMGEAWTYRPDSGMTLRDHHGPVCNSNSGGFSGSSTTLMTTFITILA